MAAVAAWRALVKAPALAFGRAYNSHAQRRPLLVGTATTVLKTSAADLFAQTVIEDKRWDEVDWRRHGLFCGFGLVYLGGFQYWLYNRAFVRLCAAATRAGGRAGSVAAKVVVDQGLHHPLVYFPVFYLLKGMVEGRTASGSMALCREELWDNCKALWAIWVPAQLVNFALVPQHLRIPYVAGVSFGWTVVLSAMRGALQGAAEHTAAATTTATAAAAARWSAVESAVESVAGAVATAAAPAALAEAHGAGNGGGVAGGGDSVSSASGSSSIGGGGMDEPRGLRALVAGS